jgi:hypothetical protein
MKHYICKEPELSYTMSFLKKKSGGKRIIYAPSKALKFYQRKFIRRANIAFLYAKSHYINNKDCVHGFIRNRSVVTSAAKHIGYETTLSFDIKNYFDSITYEMITDTLREANVNIDISKKIHFVERENGSTALAQGFVTSPILASIYSLKITRDLLIELNKLGIKHVVTMYADDISISIDLQRDYEIEDKIKEIVEVVLNKNKVEINKKKTRVLRASNGNRRMLGVMVGKEDLYPTQKVKKRLRACKHYTNKYEEFRNIADGLEEWSKLRLCKVNKNFIKD